jgi:hypothetical protein
MGCVGSRQGEEASAFRPAKLARNAQFQTGAPVIVGNHAVAGDDAFAGLQFDLETDFLLQRITSHPGTES